MSSSSHRSGSRRSSRWFRRTSPPSNIPENPIGVENIHILNPNVHRTPTYRTNDTAPPTYIDTGRVPQSQVRSWRESVLTPAPSSHSHGSDIPESEHVGTHSIEDEEVTGTHEEVPPVSPLDPHYVYYRMFLEDEPIPPQRPVFSNDHLGRIPATAVTPPHTVNSLKRCITKAEGIINAPKCDLLTDMKCDSPMGQGVISIIGDDSLGSTPQNPIALVYSSSNSTQEPAQTIPTHIATNSRFNQRIVALQDCNNSSVNRKFLNFKVNEVLLTDGVPRRQFFVGGGGGKGAAQAFKVYEATNSAGSTGFVMKNAVRFAQ